MSNLLEETQRIERLVSETVGWIESNPDQVGDYPRAWLSSSALTRVDAEITAGATLAQDDAWTNQFLGHSVATRVTGSLHYFCEYDAETIAEQTNRSVDEVIAMIEEIDPPTRLVKIAAPPKDERRPVLTIADPKEREMTDSPEGTTFGGSVAPTRMPPPPGSVPPSPPTGSSDGSHNPLFVTEMPAQAEPPSVFGTPTPAGPGAGGSTRGSTPPAGDVPPPPPAASPPPPPAAAPTPSPAPPPPPPAAAPPRAASPPAASAPLTIQKDPPPPATPMSTTPTSAPSPASTISTGGTTGFFDFEDGDTGSTQGKKPTKKSRTTRPPSAGLNETTSVTPQRAKTNKNPGQQDDERKLPTKLLIGSTAVIAALALIAGFVLSRNGDGDATTDANVSDSPEPPPTAPQDSEPLQSSAPEPILSETCQLDNRGAGALAAPIVVDVGTETRSFRLTVIEPEAPSPKGVVVWLPDLGEDPDASVEATTLEAMGLQLDFITATVAPGSETSHWNVLDDPDGSQDVSAIETTIDYIVDNYCVDSSRIILAGLGTGGFMAATAACAQESRPVSLLAIGGAFRPEPCESPVVSALFISGDQDTFFPIGGGVGSDLEATVETVGPLMPGSQYANEPLQSTVTAWSESQNCGNQTTAARAPLTLTNHLGCAYNGVVNSAVVANAGHGWPADAEPVIEGFVESLRRP